MNRTYIRRYDFLFHFGKNGNIEILNFSTLRKYTVEPPNVDDFRKLVLQSTAIHDDNFVLVISRPNSLDEEFKCAACLAEPFDVLVEYVRYLEKCASVNMDTVNNYRNLCRNTQQDMMERVRRSDAKNHECRSDVGFLKIVFILMVICMLISSASH